MRHDLRGKRALIFARESKFEARAGNRSPEEQVEASLSWCEQEGVEPVAVDGQKAIVESGVGASRHSRSYGKRRDWERAKDLLRNGDADGPIDILVTWSSSRAQRDLEEYVALRRLCVEADVLWCYAGTVYDMADGNDRFRTAIDGAVNERDVDELQREVLRALRKNAKKGRPHGRPLFGYRRIYDPDTGALREVTEHPTQGPIVRRIFRLYATGTAINAIVRLLRSEGVKTNAGRPPEHYTVTRILDNPAYLGQRLHHGEHVGSAIWPPLVGERTWDIVRARRTAEGWKRRARDGVNLLAGLVICKRCLERMFANSDHRNVRRYQCRNGHSGPPLEDLDAYVTAYILQRIAAASTNLLAPSDEPDPEVVAAQAVVDKLKEELEEAYALWEARQLSIASYSRMEVRLTEQIAEAEKTVRRAALPLDIDPPDTDDLGELERWWRDDLSAEQRREIAGALIVAVIMTGCGRGRRYVPMSDYAEIEARR